MTEQKLSDGLRFEDEQEVLIFNHFSFCELIKHISMKYGELTYVQADQKVRESFLSKVPDSGNDVEYLGHELEFHWAMLITHGEMYWTRGILSDFNTFKDEYIEWEIKTKSKFDLKDSFEYYAVN